jgi:hypothetical protein
VTDLQHVQMYRLLTVDEIKIWEAAARGTDNTNTAWRDLREKLKLEIEQAEAAEMTNC